MRRILATSLMLAVLSGLVAPACAQTIGIVLMHGKTGSPNTVIDQLATALQSAGYLVDTPEMCWSRRRIYDRPFLDCLTEIDSAIGRLKGRGAGRIVVAGMSQGGDAALAYGARQANLAGMFIPARDLSPLVGIARLDSARTAHRAPARSGRRKHQLELIDTPAHRLPPIGEDPARSTMQASYGNCNEDVQSCTSRSPQVLNRHIRAADGQLRYRDPARPRRAFSSVGSRCRQVCRHLPGMQRGSPDAVLERRW